jgi:hypothetical protein
VAEEISILSMKKGLTAILAYSQKLEKELQDLQRISGEQSRNIEQLLGGAETEVRRRKIRSVIMAVTAFLAGIGLGYGVRAPVDGR